MAIGHLEKLLSLAIADSPGVNVNESERERSGIIRRQFCGVRRVEAIFRGALEAIFRGALIWVAHPECKAGGQEDSEMFEVM